MMEAIPNGGDDVNERRRVERRTNSRIGDLTLPEVRRIFITTLLGAVVLALFLWMVGAVIIAAVLGAVIGFYLRPLYRWLLKRVGSPSFAAILTLIGVILPILAVLAYSYTELA